LQALAELLVQRSELLDLLLEVRDVCLLLLAVLLHGLAVAEGPLLLLLLLLRGKGAIAAVLLLLLVLLVLVLVLVRG
jgi:VIT1/CCC1 family predicted Fe2+/Mn2+ transporter